MLHNGAWVATILGALLGVQDKFQVRYNSYLAVTGLINKDDILIHIHTKPNLVEKKKKEIEWNALNRTKRCLPRYRRYRNMIGLKRCGRIGDSLFL